MPARRRSTSSREPITRARIVDAALALVAEQGYEGLSMRAIARRLDTGQSSLYAHVGNRNDLDSALIERVFEEAPRTWGDGPWREQVLAYSRWLRSALAQRPGLVHAFLLSRPRSQGALQSLEGTMAAFANSGMTSQQRVLAESTVDRFVIAWAHHDDVGRRRAEMDQSFTKRIGSMADVVAPEQFPLLAEMLRELDDYGDDALFEDGLALILDGIEARLNLA